MKKLSLFFFVATFLFACKTSQKITVIQQSQSSVLVTNGKLFAAAYMQRSAEYHALCLQAYNIATLRLNESLQLASARPKAIITDIDETILDNSADEVHHDLQGKGFDPQEWAQWTAMAAADTVAGALSFLKYAASKGVEVFYITNRDEKDREGTLKNLQKFDFPNADNAHLIVRQNVSSKETRRQQVMSDHDVILLLGDNLADFSALWDNKTVGQRLENVQQQASQFGNRFIVIPNPVYGDWENALYQYKRLTPPQQDSAIKNWLKNY
ncbi:MAG TPA: 5'-nucleotidase, lipoprotein e(P4) family [Chitinophagaceae bacterium]|jgi:5'-nucleotidase (lipoprotein e(P4) family)|nr:5'-nucleotidase, lipoprotein e(P4) family [Chitinophagaceae bacterium]